MFQLLGHLPGGSNDQHWNEAKPELRRTPTRVEGSTQFDHLLLPFPGNQQGSGLEVEQLEPKPVPFETQALQVET